MPAAVVTTETPARPDTPAMVALTTVRPAVRPMSCPSSPSAATLLSSTCHDTARPSIAWPRASSARAWIGSAASSGTTMTLSPDGPAISTLVTRCRTTRLACATFPPTTTATVVVPGPRATTAPLGSTVATLESPVVHVGRAPTRMLPFRSVIVAAKWVVSPIAATVSTAGRSPTHVAPMFPMDSCDSAVPTRPKR